MSFITAIVAVILHYQNNAGGAYNCHLIIKILNMIHFCQSAIIYSQT